MKEPVIRRNYKDTLFRFLFKEKSDLLSLYNAMNRSSYANPEDLEITTIEDVLYMGMKNDVSFLIDHYLNLYEIQSTWNPNMPLRGLFYFAQLYQGYVKSKGFDLYGEEKITLPNPQYVVFYNGIRKKQDCEELCLSDSFTKSEDTAPCLECRATILNINAGHNQQLMEQCQKLYEYAFLVERIRFYLREGDGITLREAISMAINDCIEQNILREFLLKHQTEVLQMILEEDDYFMKLHIKNEKAELKKREEELKKTEEEQKKTEEEQKKKEEEQKKKEEEQKKKEEEQKKKEEEQKKKEEEQKKTEEEQKKKEDMLVKDQEKVAQDQEKVAQDQEKVARDQEKIDEEKAKLEAWAAELRKKAKELAQD